MARFHLLLLFCFCLLASSCKKSKGTVSDQMENRVETEKMAIVPVSSQTPEKISSAKENNSRVALHLDALASGFKVDAIMAIYAGQHASSAAVKKFAQALGKQSAASNLQLKALSMEQNFPLPVAILPVHEKSLSGLRGKRKAVFDTAYGAYIQQALAERSTSLHFLADFATLPGLADFSAENLKSLKLMEAQAKKLSK